MNIVKFTDAQGVIEVLATDKSMDYFRTDTNPVLLLTDVDSKVAYDIAHDIQKDLGLGLVFPVDAYLPTSQP